MSKRIIHLGISGGKDSTALLLWTVHESGYPKGSIVASFCDTGNEAQETLDYVRFLSETVHPITTINPEKKFYDLVKAKKRFPSACARFCTQKLKMEPSREFVHALARLHQCEVLLLSGVRAAESDDRAKLPDRELSTFFGMEVYRPLLKWSLADVWAIHKKYGIKPNPLYAMGCKRVGCLPCIMSRKSEIALIAQKFPDRIDMIRQEEGAVRNGCGYSSMFARNVIPERYRTKQITASAKKFKRKATDGPQPILEPIEADLPAVVERPAQQMMVATIDDVVRWATNDPDYYTESLEWEVDFGEDAPACDSRMGVCE